MQRFGFGEVLVSEHDILDGIAWSLAGSQAAEQSGDRRGVRRHAGSAGQLAVRSGWPRYAGRAQRRRGRRAGRRRWRRLASSPRGSRYAGLARAWSPGASEVALTRRRAFRDERYWGRPIPGWGADRPRLLIVGLAPAAHGGNRTGRIFTGDRSGDFLFASLYRSGFAVQPTSVAAGDGQRLLDARMAAAVRCAPPDNKPEPGERDACARGWSRSSAWSPLTCGSSCASAGSPGRRYGRCWAGAASTCRDRVRRSATAPRCGWGAPGARRRAAHRLLSPEPAEYVHRSRHPGHARRRIYPRSRGGRSRRP